ncbi:MAG: hypothetical protein V4736_15735 [Bdellovibrionota bacterium]
MAASKFILFLLLICSLNAKASIDLAYTTWNETLKLEAGGKSESAETHFDGYGIGYGKRFKTTKTSVYRYSLSAFFGTATAGGAQDTIIYQRSRISVLALLPAVQYVYFPQRGVGIALEAFSLYRDFMLPQDGVTSASSGAAINFGATIGARFNLNRNWLLFMKGGPVILEGGTLYSIGFQML